MLITIYKDMFLFEKPEHIEPKINR